MHKYFHSRKGLLQRARLWFMMCTKNVQKSGVYRTTTEWIPMAAGGILTLFLFYSFFVQPLLQTATSSSSLEASEVTRVLKEGARHPLSLFTSLTTSNAGQARNTSSTGAGTASSVVQRQNYGGGHGAEDFMPEYTDIASLLNKSLSIDPLLNHSFVLGHKVSDWDEQRRLWREENNVNNEESSSKSAKMFLVTGSQPKPCQNLMGDHMLLRAAKNKMDYARIHGMEVFYNTASFSSDLPSWWVKLPLLRSIMLSRPDVEWLWWIDSDAVFTDMVFELPLDRYAGYNVVIHGWESLVYGERKWTGLNMGVFLVRNCQWTLDLFDELAPMGVSGEVGDRVGKVLTMSITGRPESFESDDQGAFIYLLNADRQRWGSKVYLEHSYNLNGYWKDIVGRFEELQASSKPGFGDERWPLVTHFTGCQICSGRINAVYTAEECQTQMDRALNLADNQVLRGFGYLHPGLSTPEIVPVHKN